MSSADYDLMDARQVENMFATIKPAVVVHYAAYSGGIGANRTYPADFYFRNTILTALTFEAAARHSVQKLGALCWILRQRASVAGPGKPLA